MSIFEKSSEYFGNPSNLLQIFVKKTDAVVPSKTNLTFKELGELLIEAIQGESDFSITRPSTPTGSPWDRVQQSDCFSDLTRRFPFILPPSSSFDHGNRLQLSGGLFDHFESIAELVSAELSLNISNSGIFEKFRKYVISRLGFTVRPVESNFFANNSTHSDLPLLTLVGAVMKSPSPHDVVAQLVTAGIRNDEISLFPLFLRTKIRSDIASAADAASLSSDTQALTLLQRHDLILMKKRGRDCKGQEDTQVSPACSSTQTVLSSWKPSDLTKQSPAVGTGDADQLRQRALLANAQKTVSRQIGRAAVSIGQPQPESEPINLSGKFLSVGIVSLDLSLFPVEALQWPEFHNGLAPSLTAGREGVSENRSKTENILTGKKRIFGVPPELVPLATYRHAGFLFGAHLVSEGKSLLRPDEIYRYLKQQNECTSVAVILGHSVALRRSAGADAAKLCMMHISGQTPLTELDIPLSVQSAALAGLGFVYAETNNRTVLETLLAEISRMPTGEKLTGDRESVVFSAGFAIGLVCLGEGPRVATDVRLAERLADLIDSDSTQKPQPPADNSARVSLLLETDGANRAVTLPAACVALGLAFLNTSDLTAADRIAIPKTLEQLENQVRSDSLMFKCFAKSLILLSSVQPSLAWIEAQLPPFLLNPAILEFRETRAAGSELPAAIDWLAIYQARMYAITGLCLAIGLKFAGSCDTDAKIVLTKVLKSFIIDNVWPATHCAAQAASRPAPSMALDRVTIETCRAAVALALATVMAGSEDASAVKQMHQLRSCADELTPHGVNSAVNTALGFLFLGGGRMTFSSSAFATSCLAVSILPRFPSSVSDNRSSLQALRHMFVLAAEERAVDVIDTTTLAKTSGVHVLVVSETGESREMTLPCSLPKDIAKIRICSDRYFGYELSAEEVRNTVYVQRKSGKTSHALDPSGNLNSDRAYISEYAEPCESQVKKLLGQTAGEGLRPTSRIGWRLTPSELAAAALLNQETQQRLEELIEQRVEDIEQTVSEKYAHLLLTSLNEKKRIESIRIMNNCVKADRLDAFLDHIEATHHRLARDA